MILDGTNVFDDDSFMFSNGLLLPAKEAFFEPAAASTKEPPSLALAPGAGSGIYIADIGMGILIYAP